MNAPLPADQYLNERNQTVRMLRALAARERRWLVEDPDEDRRDSLRALEWAAQHLEGLPENWITADETAAAPVCTCGTDYGHYAECPVSIAKQAACKHEIKQGWGDTTGHGESWCTACGKKFQDNPRPAVNGEGSL